jgi:pseudouridine synthase
MIEDGRVRVNGEKVTRLPVFVDPSTDRIDVDGVGIRETQRHLYVMLHKPAGVLVVNFDEPGFDRATVAQLVDHPSGSRLFPVGRLDIESTGLVLLTNDGEMANRLTHPRYGVAKTYDVAVRGSLDQAAIDAIRVKFRATAKRADVESGSTRSLRHDPAPEITIHKREKDKTVLRVTLREARNRQLRDVLAHLGMPVKKLDRVAIGPLELSGVAMGNWRELTRDELSMLRKATGGKSGAGKNPAPGIEQRPVPAETATRRPSPQTFDDGSLEFALRKKTPRAEMPRKAQPPRENGNPAPSSRPMNGAGQSSRPSQRPASKGTMTKRTKSTDDVAKVRPRVIGG